MQNPQAFHKFGDWILDEHAHITLISTCCDAQKLQNGSY